MGLILHELRDNQTEIGLWKIEEAERWFREKIELTAIERKALEAIRGEGKRREWLASRWLLHRMSGRKERAACLKDVFGKPYLEGSEFQISLSHTYQMAAAMASRVDCGIDVQYKVEKIRRLAPKFVNSTEHQWMHSASEIDDLHLIWSVKEALYKTYSKKKVDFRKELEIAFVDRKNQIAYASIHKEPTRHYMVHYQWLGSYLLAYTEGQSWNPNANHRPLAGSMRTK